MVVNQQGNEGFLLLSSTILNFCKVIGMTPSKAKLDGALSSLGWWKMSLLMAGGLDPDDLQGPFQPKPFYDSMAGLWLCLKEHKYEMLRVGWCFSCDRGSSL